MPLLKGTPRKKVVHWQALGRAGRRRSARRTHGTMHDGRSICLLSQALMETEVAGPCGDVASTQRYRCSHQPGDRRRRGRHERGRAPSARRRRRTVGGPSVLRTAPARPWRQSSARLLRNPTTRRRSRSSGKSRTVCAVASLARPPSRRRLRRTSWRIAICRSNISDSCTGTNPLERLNK